MNYKEWNGNKYRAYESDEIRQLICKAIVDIDDKNHIETILTIWEDSQGIMICTLDNEYTPEDLLKLCIFEDGSPVGVKVELSACGKTLEEFMEVAKDDCSNVEFLSSSRKWGESGWGTIKDLKIAVTELYNIKYYRIKPESKQIYIRPKDGFRGSVFGYNSTDGIHWSGKKVECVCRDNSIVEPYNYFILEGSYWAKDFRTPLFSTDNPPQPGTRFKCSSSGCKSDIFYVKSFIGCENRVEDSNGVCHQLDHITWIDFEIIEGD